MQNAWCKYGILLFAGLAAWALNSAVCTLGEGAVDIACASVIALWLAGALYYALRARRAKKPAPVTALILAGGFCVGLVFILKLEHLFSWHDLASYNADFSGAGKPDGHLGYIAYIVQNNALPLMNPLEEGYSVFYNPPLYHLLQAGFMKLNLLLGASQAVALENLQVFTLVCASACTLVTVELLRFLGVGERGTRTGALFICAQPMLWILGATLNNDIFATLCILLCLLFTVRWERTCRMRDIVGIALSLGAGMATKLSAALLIPCVALVFIVVFFRDLKQWKRYIAQFGAFLGLSVPEAVAWPIYHLIAYQMPLNYVRLPAETLNLSQYTLWQRFGIPNWHAIRELFYGPTRKTNHNVWMQTLKTGLFDERTLFEKGTVMWYVSYALLVLFAVMLLVALALFIRMLIQKRAGISGLCKGFLAGYGGLLILNYLKFCVDYPYVCTFNFRYVLPVFTLCSLAFAVFREDSRYGVWASGLVACFAALGTFVYGISFFTG